MKYTVYQINTEQDKNRLLFVNYERTLKEVGKIDMEIYDKVYEGEIQRPEAEPEWALEDIYVELNRHRDRHPDFRGHSLSVSDVVELPSGRWFCDSIGWQKLEKTE